jgi:hypothetical protein
MKIKADNLAPTDKTANARVLLAILAGGLLGYLDALKPF